MPDSTLYYFAVGGTGALTVEPLLLLLGGNRLDAFIVKVPAQLLGAS